MSKPTHEERLRHIKWKLPSTVECDIYRRHLECAANHIVASASLYARTIKERDEAVAEAFALRRKLDEKWSEVRALCGDHAAIGDYLSDGWEWRETHWYKVGGKGWGARVGGKDSQGFSRVKWNVHHYFSSKPITGSCVSVITALAAADDALKEVAS